MISEDLEKQIWDKERRVDVDLQIIRGIIEWFENIKTRPQMFYGENDNPWLVENGMYWFHMAFTHLGYNFQPKENEIVKRNLHKNSLGLSHQLKNKELSNEEIVKEIIDIEIENWKQLLKELENKNSKL
jgi:hypothetical protein